MQQFLYSRVFSVGHKLSELPETPSEESVMDLCSQNVRALYEDDFMFAKNCPAAQKLLVRFFDLKLPYKDQFDTILKGLPLPMPKKPPEVKHLTSIEQKWYHKYFKENFQVYWKLDLNIQWGLMQLQVTT